MHTEATPTLHDMKVKVQELGRPPAEMIISFSWSVHIALIRSSPFSILSKIWTITWVTKIADIFKKHHWGFDNQNIAALPERKKIKRYFQTEKCLLTNGNTIIPQSLQRRPELWFVPQNINLSLTPTEHTLWCQQARQMDSESGGCLTEVN